MPITELFPLSLIYKYS